MSDFKTPLCRCLFYVRNEVIKILTVKSLSGKTYPAEAQVNRIRQVNGERDISLSFSLTEINSKFLRDIETGWQVNFKGDWYHLYSPVEDMHGTKAFDADLDFFRHFSGFWHVDEAENQSMTIENTIRPLFIGTDYVLNIIDNFYANTMSYSKQENSAERFIYFINRHNAEFNIPIGTKTVQMRNRIGVRRNDIIIHEDDNVVDLQVDTDTSSFCTAIEYYYDFQETDDEGSEKEPQQSDEYISPMADKYGVYFGEPVYDERYSDKNSAREAARLKQESTFKVSFTLKASLFDVPLNEGDEVRLVYPSKSINMYIRVVEINETFDEDGDLIGAEYTFGNENISAQYRKRQYESMRDVDDLFRGKGKLDYNVMPKAVRETTAVINAGVNSEFEYRRNGIYGFNTENPLGVTRYNANGIGFSQDGGQTFENALTYLGLTASAVTTGILNTNRVLIQGTSGRMTMDGDLLTLRNTSGTRWMDIQYGEIESFYNGDLAMKFGGYTMEFYNQRNDQIGRIGPLYSLGARRPGLALIIEKDIINIGYNIDGIYRPTFRSDKADEADGRPITTVNGPFNSANEGSRLYLYANRRIVSSDTPFENDYNAQDQPSIFLDQGSNTNDATHYFGGVNRRNGAEWRVRWRQSQNSWTTRILATADGVEVRGEFNQGSSMEYKENITPLNESALEIINNLEVVKYNLKDTANVVEEVGLISEHSPAVASRDGKSVNLYKISSYHTKSIQEMHEMIIKLSEEVEEMRNAN